MWRSLMILRSDAATGLGRERPFVFQESDYIRGYFEPANLAAYRQAIPAPFTMPARPLIRVSFIDFYDMAEGPTYLETEVAVLGMDGGATRLGGVDPAGHERRGLHRRPAEPRPEQGRAAYHPAARDGPLCRHALRTRRRQARHHAGGRHWRARPGRPELLRQYGVYPQFGLLQGRVVRFGGSGTSFAELARRGDYQIRLGRARLDSRASRRTSCNASGSGRLWRRIGRVRAFATPSRCGKLRANLTLGRS